MALERFKQFGQWFRQLFGESKSSTSVILWVLRGCFGAIIIGMALIAFDHFNNPRVGPSRFIGFSRAVALSKPSIQACSGSGSRQTSDDPEDGSRATSATRHES